jgi:hypothetical protein
LELRMEAAGGPVERLRRLAGVMAPTARDTVELNFNSSGSDGALILPDAPRPDEVIAGALRCSALSEPQLALFSELMAELPGDCRRGIRLPSDGGVSLYWQTRITPEQQVRVALKAGETELATSVAALGARLNGVACQRSPAGTTRMRFYMVLATCEYLVSLFEVAPAGMGLPEEAQAGLMHLWESFAPQFPVIANFSRGEVAGTTALKLEFPGVELRALGALGPLSPPEQAAFRRAGEWLDGRSEPLNFLGVRVSRQRGRELTFYVDAVHLAS